MADVIHEIHEGGGDSSNALMIIIIIIVIAVAGFLLWRYLPAQNQAPAAAQPGLNINVRTGGSASSTQ